MNRYNIFVKLLQDRISKPPVGINGLAFSKNIVRKYGIFINSSRLPSLIFLRLFGRRSSQETAHFVRSYLINNFVKCIYIQYPDVFRQFCSYFPIVDKNISQETANISIQKQSRIVNNINNTIPHEYITNKYYGTGDDISFPTSTTTVKAPGITLHSINPIANNYLQRFINIRNTCPKFNKPIYPEMQYFANEKHLFRLLQIIKIKSPILDKKISQETSDISIQEKYAPQENLNISIQDKNISQKTANVVIPEQGGIVNNNINNTIPREYIINKYYGTGDDISFPTSTTTVRAPGITLHLINSITNNCLQRFINIKNPSSEFNKPNYPEIQYFTNEKHLNRLLQIIRKNRPIQDKKISQDTANISIPEQDGIDNNNDTTNINHTISHDYITNKYYKTGDDISFPISTTTVRAPGITLYSINSIANSYLQRFINIKNRGSKFNRPIYPEIQYFANEDHFFRLLQIIKKNRPIPDKKISQETSNIPIRDKFASHKDLNILIQDKNIYQETANILISEQGRIVNNNTNNTNTNINNTIPHEHIANTYYKTEDDISFSIPTTTVRAPGITVNSINPIVSNYLQRFINIRNTGPTFNKPIYPEIQYFSNENHLFRLLQTINKKRSIADENISQETANISNSQQSRIVNNTGLYDHIIKKSSKIINYLQEINNINNISSRVIHPLVYGSHPSFNEEELINKKIFPIQDIDLTYASKPVFNIPTSQNADIVQKKIENIPAGSINSTGINKSLIKESSQHRSVHEIHMIADKVYKIIEKKISIEKDRRGLF